MALWEQISMDRGSNIFIYENVFEKVVCKMVAISTRPQCDNIYTTTLQLQYVGFMRYMVHTMGYVTQ